MERGGALKLTLELRSDATSSTEEDFCNWSLNLAVNKNKDCSLDESEQSFNVEAEKYLSVGDRSNLCADVDELQFNASPEEFTSKKVTTKILQQIEVSVSF